MTDLLNPTTFLVLVSGVAFSMVLGVRLAKDPGFGVALMAFFLPFERIPSLDIGGFTFKINHFIGGLTFIFWILALMFSRRKFAPNPLTVPLLLMFFFFFLSGLNTENSFRQLTVYISTLIMLILYLVTINGVISKHHLQLTFGLLFAGAGLMSLVGMYQFFGDVAGLPAAMTGLDPGYTKVVFGFPRIHAFSKEPLYFANYLFIPLGVGLALFFANQQAKVAGKTTILDRLRGPWLLPLIILLFINFFLTLSRGAFIALVPFAIIFSLFYARRIFSWRNTILGFIIAALSGLAVFQILESVSYDAFDRFLEHAQLNDVLVKKQGESGIGRLQTYGQALSAWNVSPATGIGLGNFGPYIRNYPLEKPGSGWQIVNNEYLELLAETGILGLASFVLILIVVFGRSIAAYRAAKDEYLKAALIGLTAALVGIVVQYNFFSTLYIIHIWVLIGLIVATQNLILRPQITQ